MIKILHISDPHADTKSMRCIHNLATGYPEWDVVALTGDCASPMHKTVPSDWNRWPQKLKLSVPGNHDLADTFQSLDEWEHRAPWARQFEDMLFIGLKSAYVVPEFIKKIKKDIWSSSRAIVLLCHERPTDDLLKKLYTFWGSQKVLILHGHNHGNGFPGAIWKSSELIEGKSFCRSHVCSSFGPIYGLCHYIEYRDGIFHHCLAQGPEQRLTIEHDLYGRGVMVENPKSTTHVKAHFPLHGIKEVQVNDLRKIDHQSSQAKEAEIKGSESILLLTEQSKKKLLDVLENDFSSHLVYAPEYIAKFLSECGLNVQVSGDKQSLFLKGQPIHCSEPEWGEPGISPLSVLGVIYKLTVGVPPESRMIGMGFWYQDVIQKLSEKWAMNTQREQKTRQGDT